MNTSDTSKNEPNIRSGRLTADQYAVNFSDMHAPLGPTAALVEADRCYYCFDAPCTEACPTGIDIPGFIRMIAGHNNRGAAKLILTENILGGTCARVCPTETLCEEACVRHEQDQKPVSIGLLQRHACDSVMDKPGKLFTRKPSTGRRIGVVGAGPASLSCAHGLAMEGHEVDIFEAKQKPGGLNEYGLAAYKMTEEFAAKEIEFITASGGVNFKYGQKLGRNLEFSDLQSRYDSLFLGVGMGGVNQLGLKGEAAEGVIDAVSYIADLRQSELSDVAVGRRVVVIGGGMTAIDIAAQCKLLGAAEVTMVYRRDQAAMGASLEEQHFAQCKGVNIRFNASPYRIIEHDGVIRAIEFEETKNNADGRLTGTGDFFTLEADMLFKAIGQQYVDNNSGSLLLESGRIKVDDDMRTSISGVWAGGDCVVGGEDLTVAAVQDGKIAARSINAYLNDSEGKGE